MKIMEESTTAEFIRRLPDLSAEPPNAHLLMMAARSKKARDKMGIKIKDLVLERKIIRPKNGWREQYFTKLYNLAILQQQGTFTYFKKDNDMFYDIVPMAMGIYATISPRSIRNATLDLLKETLENYGKKSEDGEIFISRSDVNFFAALHRHTASGFSFFTFDQDGEDSVVKQAVDDAVSTLSKNALWMQTQTSNGYHTILNLADPKDAKALYAPPEGILHKLTLKYKIRPKAQDVEHAVLEYQRDSQEPVAGTLYARKTNDPRGEEYFVQILR